jgi:hypothetical protein
MPGVRCSECAHLGLRRFSDSAWIEASDAVRKNGRTTGYKHIKPLPECSKKAFDIPSEISAGVTARLKAQNISQEIIALHLEQPTPDDILAVVARERECGTYQRWTTGSPRRP